MKQILTESKPLQKMNVTVLEFSLLALLCFAFLFLLESSNVCIHFTPSQRQTKTADKRKRALFISDLFR